MPRNEGVMYALPGVGETGDAVQLPQMGKACLAAGEQLVGIALVPHVEHQLIPGRIQHTVQGHRQLNGAQIGGQMSAGVQDTVHQKAAYLPAQLDDLQFAQFF